MYKLREIERQDLKRINKWRNDIDLISCLGAPFRYINADIDDEWYDKYLCARSCSVRCAIVKKENEKEILGLVSLLSIDSVNRSAELHIMIGNPEDRGKGMGAFAVQTMVKHAFDNLNLRRIELEVLEDNKPAICLYEKSGFVCEGIKRRAKYKNGEYKNMILMGLLKEDMQKCDNI